MKRHFLLVLLAITLLSCNKDDDKLGNKEINEWIYREMKAWYLWTDNIPSNPNYQLSDSEFYESLLYRAEDRFSFYYEDYEQLINLLNGVSLESGFEYQAYRDKENAGQVFGIILYIKAGSPAEEAGLKRGDLFRKINGVQMTESNYSSIRQEMDADYTLSFERYNFENEEFVSQPDVEISPIQFAENPFLLDSVMEIEGQKVAYLVYTFFSPGSTETSTEYSAQMDQIFSQYKSENISHIIIDLRFNSGGSEISIRNLSSYLAPTLSSDHYVMKKQYNDVVQDFIINDPDYGENYLKVGFLNKSNNIGDQISDITFITSDHTASASEALINSLKPFQTLHIIGDTTVGKDVGSVTIYDDKHSNNTIGLQPIIVKIVNDQDQDYPEGFLPEIAIEDYYKLLYPLGSMDEPLFSAAVSTLFGSTSRVSTVAPILDRKFKSSIKQRGIQMEK